MTNTWIGFSWIDHLGVLPHSGRLFASFLAGAFFFSKITLPWNIEPHLSDFQIFGIKKIRKSPKWGLKFQGRVILVKKGPCQEACKQSSGVGKHPQMNNPSKSNPGLGQKMTFSKNQSLPKCLNPRQALTTPFWGCWTLGRGC